MKGIKISEEKIVFNNRTGITALSLKAFFLNTSYTPKNAADMNAPNNHILIFYLF